MTDHRHREEAINTQLALSISKLGVKADAETILARGQERPDVLFDLPGLRVAIEGKFADHPNAREEVFNQACGRVRRGIAHVAVAVVYPDELRGVPTNRLAERLEAAQLTYRIVSESGETEWFEGTPTSIMGALRRTQDALTQDDIVEETAKSLSHRLEGVAELWGGHATACDRLSDLLGIATPKHETPHKAAARRGTAARVSALVLANALIFQEQLSAADSTGVIPLRKLEKSRNPVESSAAHWEWIWQNVNYVAIFQLGGKILQELPTSQNTLGAFRALLNEAKNICEKQAALRHDLMGRIYHWLLHEAKYLGTYYTSVSAATLLLKLALNANWGIDFGDTRALESFKVADLACGTGTLLMASAQALADSFIRIRARDGRPLNPFDLEAFHRALMENILHGYDVLPSAVHLTASTLALLAPKVAFVRMNLFVMPLGLERGKPRLGSLDFLGSDKVTTQLSLDGLHVETVRTAASESIESSAFLPKLDLCVMNPPFVRSVGGNLLFGSLPDERGDLQTELKRRVRRIRASATAGLGSVFVALADEHLKPGGRLAFVLPAAVISGEAWAETRGLIADRYHLETVISSHDAERPNFSENTDISEVLFIARRKEAKTANHPEQTVYVNLWKNPRTIHEALDMSDRIISTPAAEVGGSGVQSIRSPHGMLGEIVCTPKPKGEQNWTGCLFSQADLLRIYWHLADGRLRVPWARSAARLPLCGLSELGSLGPDRKRIHEGFRMSIEEWSPYPGFWNHDSQAVRSIYQAPNCYLVVQLDSPRGPDYGPHLWERSGNILLAESLRTNTHRVLATYFDHPVLGNTWWAFASRQLEGPQQKALLLWLNGTVSLLLFFGRRVITQGAWMQMKQPAWLAMPVLDARNLTRGQLAALVDAYDQLCREGLQALANLHEDVKRKAIDDAISAALGLPDLAPLRDLMAREPGLTGKPILRLSSTA